MANHYVLGQPVTTLVTDSTIPNNLTYVTWLPQDFSLGNCLLNISEIIVQAMNALHGMDRYWKEVVGDYTKE